MVKYYTHITELPLSKYIECAVSQPTNLAVLTIEGRPTDEELYEAWQEIRQQYADAMGNTEQVMYLKLLKEVTLLSVNYETVQKIANFLLTFNLEAFLIHPELNKEIFDELSKIAKEVNRIISASFKFDPYHPEEFRMELKRALNQSKSLKIRLDMKRIEFEGIRNKNEGEVQKVTREYFQSILITLSDHAKYPVLDSITTYEFCERVTRFNKYCEDKQKEINGNTGRNR